MSNEKENEKTGAGYWTSLFAGPCLFICRKQGKKFNLTERALSFLFYRTV